MGYKIKRVLTWVNEPYSNQGPCPDGFHVPLQSEWVGVKTILDGLTFSETYGNILRINLKMPFSGYRNPISSGDVVNSGSRVSYWSSECSSGSGRFIMGTDSDLRMYYDNFGVTASGFSIRPFKNEFITPSASWTVINGTLGGAGIFWNQTDGIISITSNGSTGYTIADKNLGATVVYNNGDTLSESNCGYFYQQGNNYGFPRTGSVTTSSTKVDASSYGPGNYYSSSTFITVGGNRDSSNNDNLRGGVNPTGGFVEKQIYPGKITTAGIYHSAEDGLISLSSDGTNRVTIADKNLGATQVWNPGDTKSEANCGKLYQWGNCFGFAWGTTASPSSSSRPSASGYGPNNYYSSSTFIFGYQYWDTSNNTNLWGNTTDTLVARRGPCDEGFHVPSEAEAVSFKNIIDGYNISSASIYKNELLLEPKSGQLNFQNSYNDTGTGLWWTSYMDGGTAYYLSISGSSISKSSNGTANAVSIRPFKNEAVQPTTDWEVLYQPS